MSSQGGSCQACGDQIKSCGSKDVDLWRSETDAWFGEKLNPQLLCAENLYYSDPRTREGAGRGPCGGCGDVLANLSQRVDRRTLMTSLPQLSADCLQCLDTYNTATREEDADAKCPNFINVYNCALCRQKSVANFIANSPGSGEGIGPTDPDLIDTMNVNCCSCKTVAPTQPPAIQPSSSSSGLSSSQIALIVIGIVLGLILIGVIIWLATRQKSSRYSISPTISRSGSQSVEL